MNEANLSTTQPPAETRPWLPSSDEHPGRPQRARCPAQQRPPPAYCLAFAPARVAPAREPLLSVGLSARAFLVGWAIGGPCLTTPGAGEAVWLCGREESGRRGAAKPGAPPS